MVKLRVYLLCFACLIFSLDIFAKVDVVINGQQRNFAGNPELTEILSPYANVIEWHWPSAALFDLNSPDQQALLKDVHNSLQQKISEAANLSSSGKAYKSLFNQIKNWSVANRINTPVNFDLARISEEFNPRFPDGSYVLNFSTRPLTVSVIGAVPEEIAIPHLGAANIKAYFENLELLEYADTDAIYIIKPNGDVTRHIRSYRQQHHVEVPPGSTIFVPLAELPILGTNRQLNEMVATLAGSRYK